MMCLGVSFIESNLFWTLWDSWNFVSCPFIRLGNFSINISSNRFSTSARSLLCLVYPWCRYCYTSCCPKCFLSSPHFYLNYFFFLYLLCLIFFSILPSKSLIWSSASSYLLFIPSSVLFISDIAFFISDWSFFMFSMSFFMLLSILIIITPNYLINCLTLCHLVLLEISLFLSWGLFLHLPILAASLCLFLCKTVLQDKVNPCLWLALSTLFGAISDPQCVALSAGHICVQKVPGCISS